MSNKSNKQVNIKEVGLEKIEKALELFKQIEKLFPSNVSLYIHDVEGIEKLNENVWDIQADFNKERNEFFLTARKEIGDNFSSITLFSKSTKFN